MQTFKGGREPVGQLAIVREKRLSKWRREGTCDDPLVRAGAAVGDPPPRGQVG